MDHHPAAHREPEGRVLAHGFYGCGDSGRVPGEAGGVSGEHRPQRAPDARPAKGDQPGVPLPDGPRVRLGGAWAGRRRDRGPLQLQEVRRT